MRATAPNPPSGSLWEWAQASLLGANLAWTTLCLGGYRPETRVVTAALTIALLVVHFAAGALGRLAAGGLHPAGWTVLPFLAYGAANVLFVSPVPWLGWLDWLGWANMLAVFWIVLNGIRSPAPRRSLFAILILLGLAAVGLGCYQRFVRPGWLMLGREQAEQFLGRASGPFGIPNSLAAFLILLLPTVGWLAFRRGATAVQRVGWGWVALVFLLGLLLTLSRGACIGLGLAVVAWPLFAGRGSAVPRARRAALVAGVVAAAAAVVFATAPPSRERFGRLIDDRGELSRPVLWRAAWGMFRAHPLAGTGAGSYNVLFEPHRPKGFNVEPQWAHNDYLNTLSDYGAVGFVLLFGAAGTIAVRAWRGRASLHPAADDGLAGAGLGAAMGIGVVAFACHLFVDFHLKIPALAMALATTAALAIGGPPGIAAPARQLGPGPRQSARGRYVAAGAAVAVAVALVPITRIYRAEALRYGARAAIDALAAGRPDNPAMVIGRAAAELQQAVRLHARNAAAWSDLAFAEEMQARREPAQLAARAGPAEQAARRALALSVVVPEFWIRLGVALDMQGRSGEARAAFERCLELAPASAHAWYYMSYHLSLDPDTGDAARQALAKCLSLDPGNGAAEALRAKLNGRP